MSAQEKMQFEEWVKTLCPWDREWAKQMVAEGVPLAEIRYYVDF